MQNKIDRNFKIYVTTVIISVIYISWRIVFTVPTISDGIVSVIIGLILLLSEISGLIDSLYSCYGMDDLDIPKKPIIRSAQYPDIDVFITTYNEPAELLFKTINGCLNMDYPDKSKIHIFLCDDGNRSEVMELANSLGVEYISRINNIDGKAGNLNNALRISKSPYIAIFHADMIPLHNFLMDTIPYFFVSQNIGFVQTPQSFYNADLFQYNLYSENRVPSEQDYFYRYVEPAKNKTNSCILRGSNAVISRNALNEAGGFYSNAITVDFATGINIQSKGYKCFAIDNVLAIGLSPTTLKSLVRQRERWGRGSIQVFRQLKILTNKNLSVKQKISFLMMVNYWLVPYRILTYTVSPILFAVFGITILKCRVIELMFFWLPQFVLNRIMIKKLSRNVRIIRLSNVYDTILFVPLLKAISLELIGINKKFETTSYENLDKHSIFYMVINAIPHIGLWILNIIAIVLTMQSVLRYSIFAIVILLWLLANSYNLTMATFFMCGRKIYRKSERFIANLNFEIEYDNVMFQGKTSDISEGGFSIVLDFPYYVPYNKTCLVSIFGSKYSCNMKGKLIHVKQVGAKWKYGFVIVDIDKDEKKKFYTTIYDRVPSLPQEIDSRLSLASDIQYNLINRIGNKRTFNRKIVRVLLNKQLRTIECGYIRIREFNYEYILVEDLNRTLKNHLTIILSKNMYFDCELKKEYKRKVTYKKKRKYKLYKINNYKDFIYNEEFKKMLEQWIFDFKNTRSY